MEKKIHNNYISRDIAARSGELKTFREKVKDFFRPILTQTKKVKAYLRNGARKLPGFEEFPNPQVGWEHCA